MRTKAFDIIIRRQESAESPLQLAQIMKLVADLNKPAKDRNLTAGLFERINKLPSPKTETVKMNTGAKYFGSDNGRANPTTREPKETSDRRKYVKYY